MIDQQAIDQLAYWIGFGILFIWCAGLIYLCLLAGYAWPHYWNNHSIWESLKRAFKELL